MSLHMNNIREYLIARPRYPRYVSHITGATDDSIAVEMAATETTEVVDSLNTIQAAVGYLSSWMVNKHRP